MQLWLIVFILSLILEIIIPSFFMICFGIGALIPILLLLIGFNLSMTSQVIIFISSSLVTMFLLRPFFIKFLANDSEETKTNINALVGETARVTEKIPVNGKGRVKITGDSWLALADNEEVIEENSQVEILKVEGTKVYVKSKQKGE